MTLSEVVMSEKGSQNTKHSVVNITDHVGSHHFAENKGWIFKSAKIGPYHQKPLRSKLSVYFGDFPGNLLKSTPEQSAKSHRQCPRRLVAHIKFWVDTPVPIKHKKFSQCVVA